MPNVLGQCTVLHDWGGTGGPAWEPIPVEWDVRNHAFRPNDPSTTQKWTGGAAPSILLGHQHRAATCVLGR